MNMDYKEGRGDYYLAEGLREARREHDQMVRDGHGMHECASDCPLPAVNAELDPKP